MNYLIVGFGNIGHKRQAVLGKKCLATVDPDPSQKPDFAYSSEVPESLLKNVKAVVIATSRQPKLQLVEYWLQKGKHVLVEKPLILDQEKGGKLTQIAKQNKVICYTAYNHRFEPNIARIKKLLTANTIGKLYHSQFIYGFGNIKQIINSWRDSGYGNLDEIGCHQIDFAQYFFGYQPNDFQSISLQKQESNIYDHSIFATKDKKVIITSSWTTWKNLFSIDIYGSKGSLHMNSLSKWGGSELLVRKRVYPAGIPQEKRYFTPGPDSTWEKDTQYFENMVNRRQTSLQSDLSNTQALVNIILSSSRAKPSKKTIYHKLQGLDKKSHVKRVI
jgi:scyllo-inositol 2-dehydrogenase (NADP+)